MAQGVQKKTEYAGLQFLGVSAVKKLLGFEIREAPGEHARGKFRVLLSEEAPVVCERNVPVQLREEGNRAEALFCGYPQRTETMTEHGWRIAEIEAVSGTVLLDMEKRSRVFQDRRQTYLGIAGAVTAETGHSACILAGDDRETGGTLIQYGETDWKFLKRMASRMGLPLVPDTGYYYPRFYMGLPGKEEAAPITYKETERFYNGTDRDERRENELYEIEDSEKSLEDLVNTQLQWEQIGETERKIVDFCIQSLEQSGYLMIPPKDIAKDLGVAEEQVEEVLSMLKELEPQGLFASGLEECLLMQVRGMDEEELLSDIIRNHLQDIAEGKISTISRGLKISSAEVRKLIHVIKNLNPRPLNGIGGEKAQYILPDVILEFQDGQWNIELNDKWTGNLQVSDFYIHMMETAQDEELKSYFENKLRRARFIMNAVEQRRTTILGITREILKRQEDYFLGKGQLKPMTLEDIGDVLEIHKSTVSRAIRDKYLRVPSGCVLFRSLFTTGIVSSDGNGDVSRNTVKTKLKELVAAEDKKKPWGDEQLAGLLQDAGMPISRRTVAKYRMELGIGGVFQRKDG